MKTFKNMCCGCEVCVGCYRSHIEVHVCDKCGHDGDRLYRFDGKELCFICLINEIYDTYLKDATPEELISYIETMFEVSVSYNENGEFLYNNVEYTRKEILEGLYVDIFYTDVKVIDECFNLGIEDLY